MAGDISTIIYPIFNKKSHPQGQTFQYYLMLFSF